ncbi:MAG: 4Fe-4S binding protein [Actinobacteria bacterium]|nr:4Fe-4S binding protein [Actinomycetota bacterium]
MTLIVDKRKCPQDHACPALRACPVHALSQNGFDAPVVDKKRCISCGKCVRFCPTGALRVV